MILSAVRGRHAETKITGTAYGGCENNEQSPFNFGLSHLNHGDCSPADAGNNGLPTFKVLGLHHLYRVGSSPLSYASLVHWMQASTPCERLAKTRLEIMRSIQSMSSWSTVTPIRGLFNVIEYDVIQSVDINTSQIVSDFIELSSIGDAEMTKTTGIADAMDSRPKAESEGDAE